MFNPTLTLLTSNRLIHIVILAVLASGCAQQLAPTGGPKDSEGPRLTRTSPDDKTINFARKEIIFHFDEFIQLNNPGEQIVISPPLDEKPEIQVRGKSVRVRIRQGLKQSTTYTINFGNAVVDNHEGNVIENLKYVFSTGPVIDTGSVSGQVSLGFNNTAVKSAIAALYPDSDFNDSVPYKFRPVYFTKTGEDGSFIIDNIPNSTFRFLTFTDDNKNLKYDQSESMGFIQNSVNPSDSSGALPAVRMFKPDAYEINRLLDTFVREHGRFVFLVYKPTYMKIIPLHGKQYFSWLRTGNGSVDSIIIYNPSQADSAWFRLTNKDTSYTILVKAKKKPLDPLFNQSAGMVSAISDSIHILFSTPLDRFDSSRFRLKEDTVRIKPVYSLNIEHSVLSLSYPWKEQTTYALTIRDSGLVDIYGQLNSKPIRSDFRTKTTKDFSTLKLLVTHTKPRYSYIIQLMNESQTEVVKQYSINGSTETLFEYLNAGTYSVKIIEDRNNNMQWDNGDYFSKRPPERVFYYPDKIVLKAFWELEQTVNLDLIIKD